MLVPSTRLVFLAWIRVVQCSFLIFVTRSLTWSRGATGFACFFPQDTHIIRIYIYTYIFDIVLKIYIWALHHRLMGYDYSDIILCSNFKIARVGCGSKLFLLSALLAGIFPIWLIDILAQMVWNHQLLQMIYIYNIYKCIQFWLCELTLVKLLCIYTSRLQEIGFFDF